MFKYLQKRRDLNWRQHVEILHENWLLLATLHFRCKERERERERIFSINSDIAADNMSHLTAHDGKCRKPTAATRFYVFVKEFPYFHDFKSGMTMCFRYILRFSVWNGLWIHDTHVLWITDYIALSTSRFSFIFSLNIFKFGFYKFAVVFRNWIPLKIDFFLPPPHHHTFTFFSLSLAL